MKASKQATGSTSVNIVLGVIRELKPVCYISMRFDLRSLEI
jgi:hypothetical protein